MADIKKIWLNSLSFLDNSYIYASILIVLFLYSTLLFENINNYIGNLYKYIIVRLIVLLLIIYVSPKDITIAIFLAITFLITLNYIPEDEEFDNGTVASKNLEDLLESGLSDYKPSDIKNMVDNNINQYYDQVKVATQDLKKHPNMIDNIIRDLAKDSDKKSIEKFEDDASQDDANENDPNEDNSEEESSENIKDSVTEQFYANDSSNCISLYVPKNESINDVCNPVTTFNNNSLNAQGINNLMGFEKWNIKGSEL